MKIVTEQLRGSVLSPTFMDQREETLFLYCFMNTRLHIFMTNTNHDKITKLLLTQIHTLANSKTNTQHLRNVR